MNADADKFLQMMSKSGAASVTINGRLLKPGDRVRLNPRPGGDIIDMHIAGRSAVIEGIDHDDTGAVHVAVMLEEHAAPDLAGSRHPSNRFFFSPQELEPIDGEKEMVRRVLVAGIGNIFLGDDGFGVEVVRRLVKCSMPGGVDVADFGIRGMDLAYALGRPYAAAILVDAVPRGAPPGTIHVIEPEQDDIDSIIDGHHMNPMAVLSLARRLGPLPPAILIVGCEPEPPSEAESMSEGLSVAVADAVERAVSVTIDLVHRVTQITEHADNTALSPSP